MAKPGVSLLDWGLLPLRLVVGVVFIYHGFQKLFAGGLAPLADGLGGMGFQPPMVWAVLVGATEFLGGLGVLTGLLTRWAGLGLACVMAVAVFKVHWANGFSAQAGGIEFPFSLLGAAVTLVILGGGRISLGALLGKRS